MDKIQKSHHLETMVENHYLSVLVLGNHQKPGFLSRISQSSTSRQTLCLHRLRVFVAKPVGARPQQESLFFSEARYFLEGNNRKTNFRKLQMPTVFGASCQPFTEKGGIYHENGGPFGGSPLVIKHECRNPPTPPRSVLRRGGAWDTEGPIEWP